MLKLKIECSGKTSQAIILALEEAKKRIETGYSSGFDSNDEGGFSFAIAGIGEAAPHDENA